MAITDLMVKTNMDQSTDDPKNARTDLTTNVDTYNALAAQLKTIVTLNIGDGLTSSGGNVLIDLASNPGLEFSAGQLRALVTTGCQLGASGIGMDINGLSEDSSPDLSADFVPIYDTSGTTIKKAKPSNLSSGGGLVYISSVTPSAASSAEFTSGIDSTYDHYIFVVEDLTFTTVTADLYATFSTNGGSSYLASGYEGGTLQISGQAPGTPTYTSGTTRVQIGSNAGGGTEGAVVGQISVFSMADAAVTRWCGQFSRDANSGQYNAQLVSGNQTGTTAIDAVKFTPSIGNFTGTIRMYGVVNS